MTTVTTAEAAANLPGLIERSRSEKVAIRDETGAVAYLVPAEQAERDQLIRILVFEESCRQMSQELAKNLAAGGLTVEEFLADLLQDT